MKRSVLLMSTASPSLPSAATPEIVSATLDSAGRVAGMRTTLPRDPAEIAERQRAVAQGDTVAMRAAFARDNTPLKAGDLERVRALYQWMRNACAGRSSPSAGMPQAASLYPNNQGRRARDA
ncbi:MAG: hypothetical protein IPK85_04820 [Gemmatimonadetes bacterium]|nr:hypothetical protein [Gemmatimonadota bacterium]